MKPYRTLILCLVLAVAGALCWDWLAADPGELVLRLRGYTVTTSVAFALFAWALLSFALWALWWLLRLPLRLWQARKQRQARSRLADGLTAYEHGRWRRAGELLEQAAQDPDLRLPALLFARRAAEARDDHEGSARLLQALAELEPAGAALDQAERLIAQGRAEAAWGALQGLADPLVPRAARLKIEAGMALGRAHEVMVLMSQLRREQALPDAALDALEQRLAEAALREAGDADALQQRWNALAKPLRLQSAVTAAYAERAAGLGLEKFSGDALVNALRERWDEALVALYGALPREPDAPRLAVCEAWLESHPESPALLVALGRLCFGQQLWGKAEDYLHRALAHDGGGEASELLGHVFTAQGETAKAQAAYANALRLGRGERPLALAGRSLRDQIADQAVAEQRNEHGLPLLPR